MQRQVTLRKGAYLWDAGDAARTVAVLEWGRLGVKTDQGIVGVLTPRTVLGETALLTPDGPPRRRTASVVSLLDDTAVTEYAVETVRQAFAGGSSPLAPLILTTLVSQTCRNALLILAANRGRPVVETPVKGLLTNISQTARLVKDAASWEDFRFAFEFLSALRDFSDDLRARFAADTPALSEQVRKASTVVGGWFAELGLESHLEEFVAAERERARLLETTAD